MKLPEVKRKQWLLLDSESLIIGSTYPGNGIEVETDIDQWSTDDGIHRYRWDGTQAIERTEEELEADRAERPAPPPTTSERISILEEQLAQSDETAITLYEAQEAQETINAQQDEALMEIYEMIG